eukprot:9586100-Prorocentrum_lima.AAC.1
MSSTWDQDAETFCPNHLAASQKLTSWSLVHHAPPLSSSGSRRTWEDAAACHRCASAGREAH